jgi:hypothetical protein
LNGRVTILATAIGEESFADINGNGLFDDADTLLADLDEAFRDDDENGRLSGLEEFVDFNSDLIFSTANGMYNGTLCSDPTLCTTELLHVREEIVIVMACSFADISASPTSVTLAAGEQAVVWVTAEDCNGNSLPKDTVIAISTTNGRIVGDSTFTVPNQTEPYEFAVTIEPSEDEGDIGQIQAKATTLNGNETTVFLTTVKTSCSKAVISAYPKSVNLDAGKNVTVRITAADCFGDSLPEGTTIVMSTTNGEIIGTSTFTVPNRTSPYTFDVRIQPSVGDGTNGELKSSTTTPQGRETLTTLTTIVDPD